MFQTGPQEFSIYAELVSGELKFRFNEDWGNNFGDNGNDGTWNQEVLIFLSLLEPIL